MVDFLVKYPRLGRLFDLLLPLLATLAALGVGAVMLQLLGANPFMAYSALLKGAFGSQNALADTIVRATPLLLVGLGICIAFRAGVINIGGEGQFIAGALPATLLGLSFPDAPAIILVPAALLTGFLGGAVWGSLPGLLKAYFNVNEILSTIMLNMIAVQMMNFLLRGPMIDPVQLQAASAIPQTARLNTAFDLPRWIPTRLHAGALLAVALAFVVYILLWRTTIGYRIRAVGFNPAASRYAGINVKRNIVLALLLSGAFAGLAGAVQVYGVSHRMITDGSAAGFTGNAGFNGIVAALFGKLHPLGTIPAAFIFGALIVGANSLQRAMQVPAALITALNGLVVVFVVSSDIFSRRLARRRQIGVGEQGGKSAGEHGSGGAGERPPAAVGPPDSGTGAPPAPPAPAATVINAGAELKPAARAAGQEATSD
jgi:simple sugar transport system permease protein